MDRRAVTLQATPVVAGSATWSTAVTPIVAATDVVVTFTYPSIIVKNDLKLDSGSRFAAAGSIYVGNTFDADSGSRADAFGLVVVANDLKADSGARIDVTYNVNFGAGSGTVTPPNLQIPMGL